MMSIRILDILEKCVIIIKKYIRSEIYVSVIIKARR